MLEIKKYGENIYIVNGKHLTHDFSQAVALAYKNKKIKNFEVDYMEISFWENLKNIINFPFALLESWM